MKKIFIIYWIWNLIASYMLLSDFVCIFPYDEEKMQWEAAKYVQIIHYLNFAYLIFMPSYRFINRTRAEKEDYKWWKMCQICIFIKLIFMMCAVMGYTYYGLFTAITIFFLFVYYFIAKKMNSSASIYFKD